MKKGRGTSHKLHFAVLAADTCCLTIRDGILLVRTIAVRRPPHFPNSRGLPGGLIHPRETAEQAAMRHVKEKAHLDPRHLYIEQLATFSRVDRDPRGRVVAVAYLALASWENLSEKERADDAAAWMPVTRAKRLAYDHDEILAVALKRLKARITYTTLIQKLMPSEFTLTDLEKTFETLLGRKIDKRNFRKKILKLRLVKPSGKKLTRGAHRPAALYRFASPKVENVGLI